MNHTMSIPNPQPNMRAKLDISFYSTAKDIPSDIKDNRKIMTGRILCCLCTYNRALSKLIGWLVTGSTHTEICIEQNA